MKQQQMMLTIQIQSCQIYSLTEYSPNYSKTTGNLWFCSKNEATDFNVDIASANNFKSFKYNDKLIGNTVADEANGILKNATSAVRLAYLSNFWRSPEMPLIKCKVELRI